MIYFMSALAEARTERLCTARAAGGILVGSLIKPQIFSRA
jgi:hypothetical protein